jgi:hypothetical protein
LLWISVSRIVGLTNDLVLGRDVVVLRTVDLVELAFVLILSGLRDSESTVESKAAFRVTERVFMVGFYINHTHTQSREK